MDKISIAIVGGDLRFVRLAQILYTEGFDVWVYALSHPDLPLGVNIATSLEELCRCPYIIGPIPFTRDHKNINTPLSNINVSIELFVNTLKNSYLCLSALKKEIIDILESRNITYIDFMEMDEVAILNAIPTAEGAIQYAMENSEITLTDSHCLILGFGRCGKILAHKLKGLGAKVYIEARKTQDLAYISAYDYIPIPLKQLGTQLSQFDFIFNTIPVQILDPSLINRLNPASIYIELASTPGGIDLGYAKQQNITVIQAPSLPGKVAPLTAASTLYQGMRIILEKQGETL